MYSGTADLAAGAAPAATLTVAPRGLTVGGLTASDKVYDGTTAAMLDTHAAGLIGLVGGDAVTLDAAQVVGVFAAKDVGAGIPVMVGGLSLVGPDASDYALTPLTVAAAIIPRTVTVTGATAADKVYDGTATATLLLNHAALVGLVGGDVVTLDATAATGMFRSAGVGVAVPVAVTGLALAGPHAGDYALTLPTPAAAITPAVLTVTPTAVSRAYGQVNPPLTARLSGFVGGDDDAAVTGMPALSTSATPASSVGAYPITATVGTLDAANYTFVFRPGVFTVTPAATAVAATPVASATASPAAQTVTLGATVTSLAGPVAGGVVAFTLLDQAGQPVGGTITSGPVVAGVAGASYTLPAGTPAGMYTIRAVYSGTANLTGSSDTTQPLTVSPAAVPPSPPVPPVSPPAPPVSPLPPPPPGPALVGVPQFAVGADAGGPAAVTLYDPDGSVRRTLDPFPGTTGGVRTAVGDLNGDGVPDVAAGTGPGAAAEVKILDGATGAVLFDVRPFEASFTGGVFVAVGDITGDGLADLVVTPDQSGGPRVEVYDGGDFRLLANFFGIDDSDFRGGARAAVGDLNGDGSADLVISAGFGGGPRVSVYDGKALTGGEQMRLVPDFFLFEPTLRNGAYVAVGDVNGDGFADLIGGGGPGGGPRVLVVSGRELLDAGGTAAVAAPVANFFAGDSTDRGGIRVAAKNLDGDARADIVAGAGTGAGSRVTGYPGRDLADAAFEFDAAPGFLGGVFVG
jgi:hypothetical protein